MMIFTEIFYVLLKNIAAKGGINGEIFADTVLDTMHEVNFIDGKERPGKDLFKGFSLSRVRENLAAKNLIVEYEKVQRIFGIVLGNMFFETTDRPDASRLSAFIRNSGLDKELGENAPGFGAMFDNVGGRWTADLHMMTFLAYHDLDAQKYWDTRNAGIRNVREGTHQGAQLGNRILKESITDIALVVPDGLFWFGKAMEQNFNESIWQEGFVNLVAIKESAWDAQKDNYIGKPSRMIINVSGMAIPASLGNVANLGEFKSFGADKQDLANSLGELFTTFYGMTHTVGNRLIARALTKKGYTAADVDLNDLDNPATKIVQQNLYVRQPYVELGKGLLENKLKTLQQKGPHAIVEESDRIQKAAGRGHIESNVTELDITDRISSITEFANVIKQAVEIAKKSNRKFVPFIYLEGEKFQEIREHLTGLGIEWVMQGTGDQHISYQQVLAQPQKYLPFIISFVPERFYSGRPAIGFAKGYLNGISPNMVRDSFAEASYHALVDPRKNEAGEDVKGAAGIFMRITDSDGNRDMLVQSFDEAMIPAEEEEVVLSPDVFDHTEAAIVQSSNTGENARNLAVEKFKDTGEKHLIFVKSAIPEKQLYTTTVTNLANMCKKYYDKVNGYTAHIVGDYEEAVKLLARNPNWNKTNTIVGLVDTKDLEAMSKSLESSLMKDKTKLLAMEKFSEDQLVPIKGFFDLMSVMVRINRPLNEAGDNELISELRKLLNEIGIKDVNSLVNALSGGAHFEDPINFAKAFIIRLLPPTKPYEAGEIKSLYDAAKRVVESL
jgi:hypothetical protein